MTVSKFWRGLVALIFTLVLVACGGNAPPDGSTVTPASADARKQAQAATTGVEQFKANGWYWNPQESGTGFMFEAQGNRGFAGFFMYEEGTGKPVWYVAEGGDGSFAASADGGYSFVGDLRQFSGGQPAWSTLYAAPTSRSVGTVRITFTGNNAVVVLPGRVQQATRFDFNGLGTVPNSRQPETGWYWNPAEGGRGWAMEVQNNRLFMAMFHYNLDGSPTWHIVEADLPEGSATAPLLQYANGQSLASAYRAGTRQEVGSFSVSFRNPCAGQVQVAGAVAVGIRRFRFGGLPAGDECKAIAQATTDLVPGVEAGPVRMLPGDAVAGRIDTDGDIDAYGIALVAGTTYEFRLQGAASGNGSLGDPLLALYDSGLNKLQENNNVSPSLPDAQLSFTPAASGTYYLAARANGTGTGTFLLSATGLAPSLAAAAVLPASSFVGTISAIITGRQAGSLKLIIDSAYQATGTLTVEESGATLAVTGLVTDGGVLSLSATGAGGSYFFSGIVAPTGQVAGTWANSDGAGGLVFGSSGAEPRRPPTLTVRARGTQVAGVGPVMVLRINGAVVGSAAVQSTVPADYGFPIQALSAGDKVDVVFTNDANAPGEDRNLYVQYVTLGDTIVVPASPGTTIDRGKGSAAFDGVDVIAGQDNIAWDGALRLTWPSPAPVDAQLARKYEAVRLLQQATFGPTEAEVARLTTMTDAAWVADQLARAHVPVFVNEVQRWYALGDAYRPGGANYSPTVNIQKFWETANTGTDQLRRRVAFSLQQIFVVSMSDSNIYDHNRAYAQYLDILNKHAFGNYRSLLEDIALSPAMGIYLSHIRNRPENPATGLLPDENFAREVMQLFSIGLQELNQDGTLKLDGKGKPIETYNNADVMSMAKVFTGWSWAFPDAQLTDSTFRWGSPGYKVATDTQIDLLPMKPYPGKHSTAEKRLFTGKPWAVTIPPNGTAQDDLRLALDALFNHPNVGPFIGRQLIQRLATSNPSPAYVSRVAGAFNNNGLGVRGDLGAVVRAILLDPEARQVQTLATGKLKEPILRVGQWMRAMGATSSTGNYLMTWDLDGLTQRPYHPPTVFNFFRPGYVPPNTSLSADNVTAPEFQLVSEATAPAWVNLAERMAGDGLGWTGSASDVSAPLTTLTAMAAAGNIDGMLQHLNLLMYAGRMPAALRQDILDAVTGVSGSDANSHRYRARVAVFMALTSPEFLVQR